jgi:hypothetical protein
VTSTEELPAASTSPPTSAEATEWIRRNAITLTAVALIAVGLWWRASLLTHFYFRQDDFLILDQAESGKLGWSYLMTIDGGHLMPGGKAIAWALARLSLYDWTLTSTVNLLLIAAASLALLRLLRIMFGNRPGILVLLAVYAFTPLVIPGLSFWDTTLLWLPLQLAIFMALAAHLRYLETGRRRHIAAATGWQAFGMLFGEPGLLVPVVLFAVTSAFYVPGNWARAAASTLRTHWRGWLAYGVLALAYLGIFVTQLETSVQQPGKPGMFSGVLTFAWTLVRVSFIPGALGGPWHWDAAAGSYAFAIEVSPLTQLSWAVAGVIVIASMWYRRHAWRAWVILLGWLVIADMLPVVLARVSALSPTFLGMDLHYLADSVPALVICLGLAYLPVAGEEGAYRAALPPRPLRSAALSVVLCCFLAGSFWSGASYRHDVTAAAGVNRSYVDTATAAIKQAVTQLGSAAIVSTPLPQNLMDPTLLGAAAYTGKVIGPLVPAHARLTWASQQPRGVFGHLLVFDNFGRLLPAVDVGSSTRPAAANKGCWTVTSQPVSISVYAPYDWIWVAELAYRGPATRLLFSFDGVNRTVAVPAGRHEVYLPATGAGRSAQLTSLSAEAPGCVSQATIGVLNPSTTAYPMPFYPVP